ncbi:hypothetical protein AB4Z17_29975 [Paenibacillus sp. TAF43_2]|uniref:hypothetical protein n=1 Tax=Paenibacillus sp. TAF43_2 TaxID=3233069 RepID=UPI003F9E939C
MSLEQLEALSCKRLTIQKRKFNSEQLEDFKWREKLDSTMKEFYVDHSNAALKQGFIELPVFDDDEMIDYSIMHKGVYYESKANLVEYKIRYSFLGFMHLTLYYGYKVLKRSDEKFLDTIHSESIDMYFYFDYVLGHWKKSSDKEGWIKSRDLLERQKNNEQLSAAREFYALREAFIMHQNINKLKTSQSGSWDMCFGALKNVLNSTLSYQETKHFVNKISDGQYGKIKGQIEDTLSYIECARKKMAEGEDDMKYIEGAVREVKRIILEPGYWVIGYDIYPNVAEQYILIQKADSNRNHGSKDDLKRIILNLVLVELPNTFKMEDNFITMSNPILIGKLKAKK